MDVTTAAKKAFSQAREKNPEIASAVIGVMRDPETDLVTDGGIVYETNIDVIGKQVAEWDLDGIYSEFDKTCSDSAGAAGIEGTLWKVGFEFAGAEPIARMLAVIIKP